MSSWRKPKKANLSTGVVWISLFLFVSAFLLVAVMLPGCGDTNTEGAKPSSSSKPKMDKPKVDLSKTKSPEHKLASLEKGFVVALENPTVSDFSALLDNLEIKFPKNSREQIADAIIEIKKEVSKEGKDIGYLEAGRGLDGCVPITERGKKSLAQAKELCVRLLSKYSSK
ncbi:MAG: hypothetical protein PHO53_03300 [Actinomycetota bacterium]|nr:hypothetical protein [Actinomycetota bacterium]